MAATLGVATISYLPYAFFNLINPFMAILLAVTGIGITKQESSQKSSPEKKR
jgi:NhaC family Na+:H+ antiporter